MAFKDLNIDLKGGVSLHLGWFSKLILGVKVTCVGGWIEIMYIDENMRIGRGDKGTVFVLDQY